MMNKKLFSVMTLFMLILVYIPMFFTSSVVAEESWNGPDNGKPICMFPKADVDDPPNGCVYEYNYTDTNVEDNILVFDDQGALQDLYYDSEMSISANVNSVSSDSDYIKIFISITATGAYRLNKTNSYYSPNDDDFTVNLGHIGTFRSNIETELINYDPSTEGKPRLDVLESHNSANNFTSGSEGGTSDPNKYQKLAGEAAIFIAKSYANIKTLGALSVAEFIYGQAEDTGLIETPSLDLPDDKTYDIGPSANVRQTWEHKRIWPHEPGVEERIPEERAHMVSKYVELKIPHDYTLPEKTTLRISAKNILAATYYYDGSIIGGPIDGAEGWVDIPLRNFNIQNNINNPDSNYYTTDSDGSVNVGTYIESNLIKHQNHIPKLEYLKIDWDDDIYWDTIKTDWEPYYYDGNLQGCVNKLVYETHEYQVDYYGTYEFDIRVKAKVQNKYGGWEKIGAKETITIYYEGDGGGGGCPYISPWNGTKYKQENNLMVQSEFQSGEVTDYYKLDTNLQQKNGQYSMKIEEFENSEDFIDQMKLYTIDHKEGYKVGVTPEGEYITYKNSDAPIEAYNSTGDDVLNMVKEKNDDKRLEMDEGSEVILDYGDRSMSRWQFNKLILRSSGFSSHTEGSQIGTLADKTSLYVSIKADGSEWRNVTVTHPRNNPHDYVIPLEDQLTDVLGKGHELDDFKVKIESTKDHHIDYVGIDNSAPTPVHVQEADLLETIKTEVNGNTKYLNRSLTEDDNAVMHLTPGESCTVNFDVPYQIPGFEERDFVVMTKGFYTKYE